MVLAAVAQLREQEAAAVTDIGIVHPELVAVIPQRQRLRQVAGQGSEPAEVIQPALVRQLAKPHGAGPAIVAEAQDMARELCRRHRIGKELRHVGNCRVRRVISRLRFAAHPSISGPSMAPLQAGRIHGDSV